MNKTIKKMVALGLGATMLAGTAAVAVSASTLADYPSPFVAGGAFNGKIVIGGNAVADLLGAVDIAASLQRDSTTAVAATAGATTISDGFRLDTSSDRIYAGDTVSVDSATKDTLKLLSDNQFEDSEGTVFAYTQSVVFKNTANTATNALTFTQHDVSDVDSFLAFDLSTSVSDTSFLYEAKVDFTKAFDARGSNANVVGQKIVLFGNEYTFSSESDATKVVLYGSSKEVSITPKDDVKQTIDGKDYDIKVIGFSSSASKVVVSVNGVSDSVAEGTSKTIGGLKIYAKSVSSWNNGADGFATLQLGAQKVVLADGDNVKTGSSEDSVDGTYVKFSGTPTLLSGIYVYVGAADSDSNHLDIGGSFTDPVFKTFKVTFPSMNYPLSDSTRDFIDVRPSGSTRVVAKLPVIGGDTKSVYFSYNGALAWDSTKDIYPVEGAVVAEDAYTYLAPSDPAYTHLVRVKRIKMDATNGYVELEDALTGASYKTTEQAFDGTHTTISLTVDGKTYTVTRISATTITIDYPDGKTVVYPEIQLKNGETFALVAPLTGLSIPKTDLVLPGNDKGVTGIVAAGTHTYGTLSYDITLSGSAVTDIALHGQTEPALVLKEERDYGSAYNTVTVETSVGVDGVDVAKVPVFSGTSTTGDMKDSDTTAYVDYFGTYVTANDPSGSNNVDVKVYYPQDQMYANVFVAPTSATTSTSSTGGAVAVNPIAVGMAIMDNEATLGSKPYIVVGGPCVNTVAAALLGNPTDCAAGFTEGKAKIKLFSDKNALLVAGYSARDTQGASRVLANYKDYKAKFTGTELEVVTTNLASLSVNNVQ